MNALRDYLGERGWSVLPHQAALWRAYAEQRSGLLHAPTGSGKSLAALGAVLNSDVPAGGLRLLWITPLRALAADLAQEFAAPVAAAKPGWRVELRTGDTSARQRQQQRRGLPEILITTPESASLLLSYGELLSQLRGVQMVVVDEWHELLASKRGVQTQLVLAALRALSPQLRVWGLSATIGNLPEALAALVPENGLRIDAAIERGFALESLLPDTPSRLSWAGHLGLSMLPQVVQRIVDGGATLLFAQTRAQAELWFEALDQQPQLKGRVALHHGSLDRELRSAAERGLKQGLLQCVVATTSLDLGVDFAPVDQVIQLGSPRMLARLIQRAGRAAHRPGGISRVLCVPTHQLELAEFAAARQLWAARRIEPRPPAAGALDVLLQHVVTRCLGTPQDPHTLYAEIRSAPAYAHLDEAQWDWVLDFLGRGGSVLQAYPDYHRIQRRDDGLLAVSNATVARRHRMMIGTIASETSMRLCWLKGGSLGHVEERFIARLKPGDRFLFGGRALELVRVKELTAYVRLAQGKRVAVPRWSGGRLPLSEAMALAFLDTLQQPDASPEHAALAPLLALQQRVSALPSRQWLLVETTRSREGWHLALYPCAGRAVHEGLGALLAHRASQREPRSITVASNDYGLELLSNRPWPQDEAFLRELLAVPSLDAALAEAVNAAELARRHFREIAQAAGLVFTGYPGSGKSARQVQMSTGLLFDVFSRYDPDNPLLRQTYEEVLARELDAPRLRETLARLQTLPIRWHATERLSPFAFPLYAESQRQQLSSESLAQRLAQTAAQIEADSGD